MWRRNSHSWPLEPTKTHRHTQKFCSNQYSNSYKNRENQPSLLIYACTLYIRILRLSLPPILPLSLFCEHEHEMETIRFTFLIPSSLPIYKNVFLSPKTIIKVCIYKALYQRIRLVFISAVRAITLAIQVSVVYTVKAVDLNCSCKRDFVRSIKTDY